jgi:hypothetical protein
MSHLNIRARSLYAVENQYFKSDISMATDFIKRHNFGGSLESDAIVIQ